MGEVFERKVVVVTGASAGVGRAIVRAFGARGAHIGLIARGIDGLEAARREVESMGGRALVLPLDVADAKAVEAAAERVERELGPIDIWVNDAMVSVFAPIVDTTPAEFKRVTEVTYLGYVHGTLAALRRMRPRNRGTIIQIGSALAYRSIPLQAAYCAAKHAVKGFSESLRTELLHDASKVRVTQVHLPAVNTPQFTWSRAKLPHEPQPVPPTFQPEVVADAVVYAAEHDRREILGRRSDNPRDPRGEGRTRRRRSLPRGPRIREPADQEAARSAPARQPLRARAGRPRRARSDSTTSPGSAASSGGPPSTATRSWPARSRSSCSCPAFAAGRGRVRS